MFYEVKKQCMDHSDLLIKYLPHEPRLNNERSMNLYQEHMNKMKTILHMTEQISKLEEKLQESSKQYDVKCDHHEELLQENKKLQEKIKILRAKKLPPVK